MLFNTNAFIFVFLPLSLMAFHWTRLRFGAEAAFVALFVCSLGFYGWWDWTLLPLLLGSILVNLVFVRRIVMYGRRVDLIVGIVFNLGLIAVFKYLGFLATTVNYAFGLTLPVPEITLPIGISFYTFQQIAYLIDVASGKAPVPARFSRYGLFVTFFPQLIAGPIVHHKEMMGQFEAPPARAELRALAATGVIIFIVGLAKKTMIADPLGAVASPIFQRADIGGDVHFFIAWVGTLAYTFQIYFDFSAYSDMAVGLALMFGVRLPTNFNSPYKARSIIDFWRRWHMTLSRFLRDYLYIPLGGGKAGKVRRYLNLMIVMLIGGLWHGASWTFVLWGGLHGAYLMINHAWLRIAGGLPVAITRVAGWGAWPMTFLAVTIAWVLFRAETFSGALALYAAMFGFDGLSVPLEFASVVGALDLGEHVRLFSENDRTAFYEGLAWIAGAAVIAWFAPNALQLNAAMRPTVDFDKVSTDFAPSLGLPRPRVILSGKVAVAIGCLFYVSLAAINSAQETEFLYFQF